MRSISDFTIRGDAWLWWSRAEGQYARDNDPAVGSVLVFKRSNRLTRGHVSLVSRVIDDRTIEVDHTWLEGEGLRRHMRVIDVSARGDWSRVRVWHEPSDSWGLRTYPTYGFILPDGMEAQPSTPKLEYAVMPSGRTPQIKPRHTLQVAEDAPAVPSRKPLLQRASLTTAAETPATSNAAPSNPTVVLRSAMLPATVLPMPKPAALRGAAGHKDVTPAARTVTAKAATGADAKAHDATATATAIQVAEAKAPQHPGRKPQRHSLPPQVASTEH